MSKNSITFRLRKMDADLMQEVDRIDSQTLSDLCRNGLRIMLGIRTTKQIEVKEREITIPIKGIAAKIGGKQSKPFLPNQK